MGAAESRARAEAGEIVTVDPGRHVDEAEATDPVLQQLALLTSVRARRRQRSPAKRVERRVSTAALTRRCPVPRARVPLQVEPILPSGDVSFGEQLAAELEEEDGPPGAQAAANAIKALRAWNRERADGVAATQEVLMTRIDRAELLSDDVMRRASRAGAVGRMLAADLKHGALRARATQPASLCLLRSRLRRCAPLASRARCGIQPCTDAPPPLLPAPPPADRCSAAAAAGARHAGRAAVRSAGEVRLAARGRPAQLD